MDIDRGFWNRIFAELLIWIKIDLFGSKSLLIREYYKPHEHKQHSWEEFSKSLSKARKLNCNIWVAGDFNLPKMDWDHMCPSPDCKHPSFYRQITEVLNDSNLTQTVSLPTRDSNILDLFFTTNPTLVQRVSILPGISNHDIVQIQVNTSAKIFFRNHGLYPYTSRKTGIGSSRHWKILLPQCSTAMRWPSFNSKFSYKQIHPFKIL